MNNFLKFYLFQNQEKYFHNLYFWRFLDIPPSFVICVLFFKEMAQTRESRKYFKNSNCDWEVEKVKNVLKKLELFENRYLFRFTVEDSNANYAALSGKMFKYFFRFILYFSYIIPGGNIG